MSRMFRIINEGAVTAPTARAATAEVVAVPFIEVGGPEGVVTSGVPDAPRVVPLPRPELTAVPVAEAGVTAPAEMPAPEGARYLSVAFHRLPKVGLRLVPNGVAPELVAVHFPDHPVSLEYRAVRDELRRQFEDAGPRAVALTAAVPESGTTTVVLNLAASLAREPGAKVLVVDASAARPAVAARLGVAEAPGLAEVLGLSTPLAWAVQPTPVANLHALAAGGSGGAAADFPRLLGQLKQWFDWVLVDAGVWADSAVPTACDAVYLVSRQTDIERPEFTGLRAAVAAAGGVPRGYITTRE